MDKFTNHIEKVIQKVLNEAAESKASEVSEKLHGNQKKIDVAEPKGKITADDFKKLKMMKKKETQEQFDIDAEDELEVDFDEFDPRDKSWEEIKAHTGAPEYSEIDENESIPGDYEGDEEAEEEAEELSAQEPTYVGRGLEDNKPGKMFASFSDDHGWFDQDDRAFEGDFDFDYDEEEFDEFEPLMKKYGKLQKWFAPHDGKRFFDMYKEKLGGPMRVRTRKMMEGDDAETQEGNAFTKALDDARDEGRKTFEVGDKTFNVRKESKDEKWIQKTDLKKGALHKELGIPEGNKIPKSKLNKLKKELTAKGKGEKKLSAADLKLLKQVNLALTLKDIKETQKPSLQLTESELIDLIEKIVLEQKVQKVKSNFADKTPIGLQLTDKVLRQDGKENEEALTAVSKKMNEYLKDGSKGKFDPKPKHFPKGNGELAKMDKKAYVPDSDVEEYIEDFSYGGGMENLDYDEIKPNEDWLSKNIEGSSKTGNSSEYANAVETELGKKINQKRKKNMFSQEKKNSYKKSAQPTKSSEESKGQKDSDKLYAKLESTDDKKHKIVMEQIQKMKNLFSYNQKTQ